MEILIDTNIFLDYFFMREGFEDVKTFFSNCFKMRYKTYLSSISLRDIGYISKKYLHSEVKAREIQIKTYQSVTKIIDLSADDSIGALYSEAKDYEDGLLMLAAERCMLDLIITNNVKDFKNSSIPAITPKEFNDIINKIREDN